MMLIIVGILHLSSSHIYTRGKKHTIYKEFTAFQYYNENEKILIKTSKPRGPDVYSKVQINLSEKEDGCLYGVVLEYLTENIDDQKLLRTIACCHWNNKILSKEVIDLTPYREDLTGLEIYSIDPIGCDDIDDALHATKLGDVYQIGVHIADVSSYIQEGSLYDTELANRASTVYYAFGEPSYMISKNLSIEHMSLKSGNPKRTFSILLTMSGDGSVLEYRFIKSMISVTKNLSYDQVTEDESNTTLKILYDLGKKMYNEEDEYDSHKMVEVYMLLANKLVAEYVKNKHPETVLLRCHTQESESALYKLGNTSEGHYGLGLELYTHFTSPIRRYADILVHRQLYNCLYGNIVDKIPDKIIGHINHYSQYYKKVERYSQLLSILDKFSATEAGKITSISFSDKNVIVRVCLLNYSIELNIVVSKDVFNHEIDLHISQDVIVGVTVLPSKSIERVLIKMISPDIVVNF
jgi:exoribonuclease R